MRRGARHNPDNRFDPLSYEFEVKLAPDEARPQIIPVQARSIINKIESPDLPIVYSMNPYAGCEHGCLYCYARNSHEYWGFSAGIEFETKLLVKKNAPQLLREQLSRPDWRPHPIMLAGNTDCYQPIEREYRLTRQLLEILLAYRHPVSIITKNALILRDVDLLVELSRLHLVHVYITVTTLREEVRKILEPRTAAGARRIEVIRRLREAGIPAGVMVAPIVPGLTDNEILPILKAAGEAGAQAAAYTIVRLNGALAEIFETWLREKMPDRAERILHLIAQCHDGRLNDTRWGQRIRGAGTIALTIERTFQTGVTRYLSQSPPMPPFDLTLFRRGGQGSLFEGMEI
ncbi:MAG: PA0069 family radical SAM protein [Bacteroidia bacterium]|nr:PA0069 family radical SAM protein [Bacteroidia bacterium]MCX7651809.1 PA0069 family radical SAM protein [Bacteroidia bacterium]MDW8417089.1 PA0069 family radical SAM protein [Bacteroidia bacterium]